MSQSSLKVRVSTASCFQRTSAGITFDSLGENLLKLFLQLGNIGRDELPTENTSSINCVGVSPPKDADRKHLWENVAKSLTWLRAAEGSPGMTNSFGYSIDFVQENHMTCFTSNLFAFKKVGNVVFHRCPGELMRKCFSCARRLANERMARNKVSASAMPSFPVYFSHLNKIYHSFFSFKFPLSRQTSGSANGRFRGKSLLYTINGKHTKELCSP